MNAELREIYKAAPLNPSETITFPPYGVAPIQAPATGDWYFFLSSYSFLSFLSSIIYSPICCEPFMSATNSNSTSSSNSSSSSSFNNEHEPTLWCRAGCGSNVHKSCFDIYATHVQHPLAVSADQVCLFYYSLFLYCFYC